MPSRVLYDVIERKERGGTIVEVASRKERERSRVQNLTIDN